MQPDHQLVQPLAAAGLLDLPAFIAHGVADQRHRGQRRAQFVRHDAHGGQRVLQVLTPQVGRRQSQQQGAGPTEADHDGVDGKLLLAHGGHRRTKHLEQRPGQQGPADRPQGGCTPVGHMVINQHHGAIAGQPDRIAVVAKIHPAEKNRQLDPENHRKNSRREFAGRVVGDALRDQQQAQRTHDSAKRGALVRLRQPLSPDPPKQGMTHQREQPEPAQAPARRVQNENQLLLKQFSPDSRTPQPHPRAGAAP